MLFVALLATLGLMDRCHGEPPRFEFHDGDRVVWIGDALIEREQRYGYWETAITSLCPDKDITFRNLGWSGDNVWGEARAGFDSPAQGYKRLVEHTLALKPTVVFIAYGTNESFVGDEGLPRFEKQLDKLLSDLAPSKARFVLLAPPLVDEARWPAGKAAERNQSLKRYTAVIKMISERRGAFFVGELCQLYGPAYPITDDGMHLTAFGYWWSAHNLLNELRVPAKYELRTIELDGQGPVTFRQNFLFNPPVSPEPGIKDFQADCVIHARNLKPGTYTLMIDGQPIHTADARTWMASDPFKSLMPKGPSLDQAEKLRRAIVEKNRAYFYRWRPQNVTYLFGFRKHEQGQNASEIPRFDPIVAECEKTIAKLRVPVSHRYELVPESKK